MTSRRGTREGDNGEEYRRKYTKEIFIGVIALLLGGGSGTTLKEIISPSNATVVEELHMLQQDYNAYKLSHAKEEDLKDKIISNSIATMTDDLKEVKADIKKLLNK